MSRIGRKPIAIPAGVEVSVDAANLVTVKGPKGTLTQKINSNITVEIEGNVINVTRPNDEKENRSLHGLSRTLINNMVIGVTAGFKKELAIVGVGYKATLAGSKLTLNLGYSHTIVFEVPKEIKLTVTPENKMIIEGIDKQLGGETAAQIRRFRPPEPYKGKGIRYVDERIILKEGKSAG